MFGRKEIPLCSLGIVFRDSPPLLVHLSESVFRVAVTLLRSQRVPLDGGRWILVLIVADVVHRSKAVLPTGITFVGSLLKPIHRRMNVLGDAFPDCIHGADFYLSSRITRLGLR